MSEPGLWVTCAHRQKGRKRDEGEKRDILVALCVVILAGEASIKLFSLKLTSYKKIQYFQRIKRILDYFHSPTVIVDAVVALEALIAMVYEMLLKPLYNLKTRLRNSAAVTQKKNCLLGHLCI